jgi:hypothetical protein
MNEPLSEQFFKAAKEWVDLEAAASMLEDSKSSVLAQGIASQGDGPVNRAETAVKASADWRQYIEKTGEARKAANLAKVKVEYFKMRFQEWSNAEANARVEARL